MHTAPTFTDYATLITKALADAEYPAADPLTLANAAHRLDACGGDLELAIPPVTEMGVSYVARDAVNLLYLFQAAMREAGRPDLIAARLTRWAEDAEYHAGRHDAAAGDYEAMAARRRARGNDDEWATAHDSAAAAARSCAARERETAAARRARAAAMLQREAA
jgi:hypothetical protein